MIKEFIWNFFLNIYFFSYFVIRLALTIFSVPKVIFMFIICNFNCKLCSICYRKKTKGFVVDIFLFLYRLMFLMNFFHVFNKFEMLFFVSSLPMLLIIHKS